MKNKFYLLKLHQDIFSIQSLKERTKCPHPGKIVGLMPDIPPNLQTWQNLSVCHGRRVLSKIIRARNVHSFSLSQKWISKGNVDLKLLSILLKKVTAGRLRESYTTSVHKVKRRQIELRGKS